MKERRLFELYRYFTINVTFADDTSQTKRVMRLPDALFLLDESINPGISIVAKLFLMNIYSDYLENDWKSYPRAARQTFIKEHSKLLYRFEHLMRWAQKEMNGFYHALFINFLLFLGNFLLLGLNIIKHSITTAVVGVAICLNLVSMIYLGACINISKHKINHLECQKTKLAKLLKESDAHWGTEGLKMEPTAAELRMRYA